ncbi:uncharacterized protein LOC142620636 [Castanea sativa]|uniref:uncharacterized protein LOC142620636 n=1 Tax=Castanea sativa TaxID=21020 RepID=UPI003F652738
MEAFQDVLDEYEFKDLGFVGGKYTWYRGIGGGNTIWERLDCAVATTDWIDMFPATKVVHLECGSSDHKPLIIRLKGIQIKQQKSWRFEQMWLKDTRCSEVVDLAWRRNFSGNPINQVEGKLKECQVKLKQWSHVSFGSINRSLKEKKQQQRQVEHRAIRGGTMEAVHRLKWEINGLLIKEEKMWKQRSRALWPKEGDQNTKKFHNRASHKYKRNRIEELKNETRGVCTNEEEIAIILIDYYQQLFTSASPSHVEEVLRAIPFIITEEQNAMLAAEFVKAKVDEALKQMEPLKAPGPDGLPPLFYQKSWPSIGEDVLSAILNCLNSGSVFEAKSKKGSFAWQRILKARHVIEKGMLRRVGDGSRIQVFNDNSIPGCFPAKAVPLTQDYKDDSTVCSLIDQQQRIGMGK